MEDLMSKSERLFNAIRELNSDDVNELLDEEKDLVNMMEANVIFPLHAAVIESSEEIVEILLNHNADIEAIYKDRNATPLDCAVVYGRKDIIPILICRGAKLDGKLQTAMKGASGGFEEYEELPSREEYRQIVELLQRLGAKNDGGSLE